MSDVMNSIFGRAQNETPGSEAYGYGTTEAVDTDATEAETAEDVTETEDAADETAVADDLTGETESDDESHDESDDEDEDEDEDTDEAVAADTDSAEESDEAVAAEPEAAEARPAAGARGSTTIADGVVAKIVIMVARKADGVHDLAGEEITVEVADEVVTIKVPLVVEFGHAVKALAEQIRVEVIDAVEKYLGLEVAAVDVHVADIHLPDAA
ncbi:Asp23/Gls24 family envelope stress response protein [Amycolatopsis sp. cmx-4-68]|uniref:Asp23/Gls24 family envelope stress response protein n=1 Tax=Amycolatopsis sp. cmx-4-68 TaxID=2790938 RepID=UPI00397DCACE